MRVTTSYPPLEIMSIINDKDERMGLRMNAFLTSVEVSSAMGEPCRYRLTLEGHGAITSETAKIMSGKDLDIFVDTPKVDVQIDRVEPIYSSRDSIRVMELERKLKKAKKLIKKLRKTVK